MEFWRSNEKGMSKRRRKRKRSRSFKKLRILTRAIQDANTYYSDDLGALVFGYFPAFEIDSGNNLPSQRLYSHACPAILSPRMSICYSG